jgi:mannose-6-phosphate isomerase-like protein (cupin superfamily)
MHIHIDDVAPEEISSGVFKRVLLKEEQSRPGGLSANHYTLTEGEVVFDDPMVEYQHYIIQGCGLYGRRLCHGETAIFVPAAQRWGEPRKHTIAHLGEGELRFISFLYRVPRPAFRWGKGRMRNLHEVHQSFAGDFFDTQIFTEEEHAVMGALRMHAIDVQTNPPGIDLPKHRNPEEIMYFLRGEGEALSQDIRHKVRAGSLIYTPEGESHGIYNTNDKIPLQYFVLEFIEHDKMWTEKGYIGKDWKPSWK